MVVLFTLTILLSLAKIVNQDYWVYVIVLSYGILIEVVQLYLPYRSFEFLDILADFRGILFASFF
ncbi:VanZ family protein [Gammaproteobacteria bacterium]|nr:VanZ family protein [Gammaproteobacteria bacterium]